MPDRHRRPRVVVGRSVAGGIERHGDVARCVARIEANVGTHDIGKVSRAVKEALASVGDPPTGVHVDLRGQLIALEQIQTNLLKGLGAAVLAILLLLTAYYQSIRLTLITLSALPATLLGSIAILVITNTTLNLQSFMGAIMALGVSVANAILLVTFAERLRLSLKDGKAAAVEGGASRLRPIAMTSCAMIAGMIPMALGLSENGGQAAPLGRAVVGGLIASTFATLFVVPSVFALVMGRSSVSSVSLDPDDPESPRFDSPLDKIPT